MGTGRNYNYQYFLESAKRTVMSPKWCHELKFGTNIVLGDCTQVGIFCHEKIIVKGFQIFSDMDGFHVYLFDIKN